MESVKILNKGTEKEIYVFNNNGHIKTKSKKQFQKENVKKAQFIFLIQTICLIISGFVLGVCVTILWK